MSLDFITSTETSGRFFDFECPFEYPDGRRYRPRLFTAQPLGHCIRCDVEVCAEADGQSYDFVFRFWEGGPACHLFANQHRLLAMRVRLLVYAYLAENQQLPPYSRAGEPIERDIYASPPPPPIP